MTEQDRAAFAAVLGALGEAFNEPISKLRAAIYFDGLSDLSIEEVRQAAHDTVRSLKFFPKVSELREAVFGNPADVTETAWLAWKRTARRVGAGASVQFSDPALADALVAIFGGWPEACLTEFSSEMWAAKRKEFERVYRVLSSRNLTGSRYLIGTHEKDNGAVLKGTPVVQLQGLTITPIPYPQSAQLPEHVEAPHELEKYRA
jgi:hypothetical protein